MTLELSHFTAAVLFSVFASVVFGITQRNTSASRSATACIASPCSWVECSWRDG